MEYNDIKTLIQENEKYGCKFLVKYKDGLSKKQRLFISTENHICAFLVRSRTKGRIIPINYIDSIKPICNNSTEIDCCRNNLRLVIKYLTASGLWKPMLNGAIKLQTLSDDVLLKMKDWNDYHSKAKEIFNDDVQWFGSECFLNLFSKRIKTMDFMSYDRDYQKRRLKEFIDKKENLTYRWRKNYDNHYEVRFDNDYARGWYSEEFKNCGNGHYYFMLDECHALFGEDD